MESVLISIRPKWCEKICCEIGKDKNSKPIYEKRIEVRKSKPKEVPFKCYIYCSKDNANEIVLLKNYKNRFIFGDYRNADGHFYTIANGKVIGEFICDKVDEYTFSHYEAEYRVTHVEQKAMCLNQPELIRYGKGKTLYGWHISELKIYEKPKKLSELWGRKNCLAAHTVECWNCFAACREINGKHYQPLTRPPQSWCYVEEI